MKIKFSSASKITFSQGAGITIAALVLLSGLLICSLTWINLSAQLEQKTQRDAQRQMQQLALALAPSLIAQDRISLNISLNEWNRGPEIHGIQVYNNSQILIAESGRIQPNSDEVSQVITQDSLAIGSLRASINKSPAQALTSRYLTLGLLATILCSLVSGLIFWMLADYFLAYLHRFANAAEDWQITGLPLNLPKTPKLPQLQRIHDAFERCSDQLNKQQDIEEALEQFAGNINSCSISGEYQSSSLLFIEINNLKELQKTLSAKELISTLNRYYWLLVQAAKLYHGRVERYAGNGAVIIFGNEQATSNSAQAAQHCLYAAQLFLGLTAREHTHSNSANIDFRIALHFGEVLLAPIAEHHNRHDLVGDTLHWAAHLASNASPKTLLASDAFYQQLEPSSNLHWQASSEVKDLRGNTQQTWVLEHFSEINQTLIDRQIDKIIQP